MQPGQWQQPGAGVTPVTCSAVDKVNRRDSCSFSVTVVRPPTLRVRTILAYGDSLTAGQLPDPNEYRATSPRYIVRLDQSYPAALGTAAQGSIRRQHRHCVDAVAVDGTTSPIAM